MKNRKLVYIILLFTAIISALAFTALRTVALIDEFDSVIDYYAHDAILPNVFSWGSVAVIAAIFVAAFIIRRSLSDVNPQSDSGAVIFSAAMMAFMIIAVLVSDIFTLQGSPSAFTLLTMIFAFPAALYFLIGVALPVKSRNGKIALSIFLMLWLFAVTLNMYFSGGTALNSPNRALKLATVAVYLFFFVNECRYNVAAAKGWSYVAFGLASVVLGGMYSLPNVILVFMNLYPEPLEFSFELVIAVIWIYVLMRMCIAASDLDEHEDDNGDEAEDAAPEAE